MRAYCVGGQRGRQNVKCGRIARWEREIEQERGRGKKLNPRDFIRALLPRSVSAELSPPLLPQRRGCEWKSRIRIGPAGNDGGRERRGDRLRERQWNIHKGARVLMIKIDLRNSGRRWSDTGKCVHYGLRFHGRTDVSISKALRDVNAVFRWKLRRAERKCNGREERVLAGNNEHGRTIECRNVKF